MLKFSPLFFLLLLAFSCKKDNEVSNNNNIQIAFLSDVHLQDIYGEFSDTDYKGVLNPKTNKYTLARTMQSQLQSTRLFNENYFAFLAALDDVVKKNVKYVVLPGDFSDDGQAINIRGLKHILNKYTKNHGIQFIITTGNHDPVRPFYQDAGKRDFLGEHGKKQPIFSTSEIYTKRDSSALPVVITKDIAKLGYKEILTELKDFGFYPKSSDVYWETPFTNYLYKDYTFENALKISSLSKRNYIVSATNNTIPDVSYLVEPADDLWFLAIDANVYVPIHNISETSKNPKDYSNASVGYNHVLTHKKHLFKWLQSVTERAEKLGKTLIVFSHYPTIDFNDDASTEIKELFGKDKMQMHRLPDESVADFFIKAGIKVHFGGHMHINDTGYRSTNLGSLINIQIPSLAAYVPAYKLLTIKDKNVYEIETIVIDSVPNFTSLFPLYEAEFEHLKSEAENTIWNKNILNTTTYKDFTEFHLKELVRLRFLIKDWPLEFRELLINSSGKKLLQFGFKDDVSYNNFKREMTAKNIDIESYEKWNGLDMIHDFYKIKNADELAFTDIDKNRLEAYKIVCNQLKNSDNPQLKLWAQLFLKMCQGEPSNHFQINLDSNTIKRLKTLY
ncbi:metallophosphoesterase [Aureibaculum luteum]|uniref:metallophosphoesterase n=1 Tax=Aureibaculum luteum TaxID=1548456 RepID=UPI000E506EF8|nr:metallophosphoesterase [Aureibaculum luteum]